MNLTEKSGVLEGALSDLGSVLVAYSGGTDSAFLAFVAYRVLGDKMLAVIADSASLPRTELAAALAFTITHGIPTHVLQTAELDDPDYQRNDRQRCFHCKDELFTRMEETRLRLNFQHIAYGMNLDDADPDVAVFRPGQKAAANHHAIAPLVTASLTKPEIRSLARTAGLSLADKPASACLASRIEYGRPVTRESLLQVEQAEDALHVLGFRQVRVRHHGELARVEIDNPDLSRAFMIREEIVATVKRFGFVEVLIDPKGYRSGSMNKLLPVSDILSAAG